jgi:mono/diheme cytochrome c family protein
MSAERRSSFTRRRSTVSTPPSKLASHAIMVGFAIVVGGCSWFTDFKVQPKIDPWETAADSIAFRGNPQFSVPVTGSSAPGLVYGRTPSPLVLDSMAVIVNPVAADARSLDNGRKLYQINCATCHGVDGAGSGPVTQYGMPPISLLNDRVRGLTDGYVFGIMRNGRGLMPSYNRLQEMERWDVVNYIRGLHGRHQVVIGAAGLPGETGRTLPTATELGPTRPAPYYNQVGAQATVPFGTASATPSQMIPGMTPAVDTAAGRFLPAPDAPGSIAPVPPAAAPPTQQPSPSQQPQQTRPPADTTGANR